uniref:Uncharacterized protein n=1 Tax=Panagrolaimus superbus TaxID=310955 RepID=A0A914Y2Y3_9BILA
MNPPEGYTFKILSLFADSKVLIVANDEKQYIQSHLPFYFNTTNLTLACTANYENALFTDKTFLARISIVNLKRSESNDYCTFNETSSTWSSPPNKYTTKVKCQKYFTIVPGHQLYADVTSLETTGVTDIETFIDVLRYYVDEDLLYPVPFAHTGLYAFSPFNNNDTKRNITFEYTSDESLIYQGFSITFKDFVFPDFDERYSASIQITSDKHVLINTDGIYKRIWEGRHQKALILSNRNTTLIFKSSSKSMGYISVPIGSLRLWATSFNDEPLYIFKSDEILGNQVLTIELSEELKAKNETLEMFYETSNAKHFLHCLTFYKEETMETIIKINLINSDFVINSGITIYKYAECEKDLTKLFVRGKTITQTHWIHGKEKV